MSPSLPLEVLDYIVLPLRIHSASSCSTVATHYVYVRSHNPKTPQPESSRSIFLVNIPVDCTDFHLRFLFTDQLNGGRIEGIVYETTKPAKKSMFKQPLGANRKKRKRVDTDAEELAASLPEIWDRELHPSGSTAVVTFVDKPSMELTLKAVRKAARRGTVLEWGQGLEERSPALGSQRYLNHHNLRYPAKDTLQSAVDNFMSAFSTAEAAHSRLLARQRQVPDEDGFIKVTRGGRTGPARVEETQEKMEQLKKKEQDKRDEMGDFYRFQVRERKKQRAGELVKRFEEDKRRVQEMRNQRGRRFKPM